jgi:hypothetical protein
MRDSTGTFLPPPASGPAGYGGPTSPVGAAVLVAAAGLALGFLTLLGQIVLHGEWLALVNSGAMWLLPAFLVGAAMRSDGAAALAGTGLLVAAVVGYYAPVPFVVEGAAASTRSVAIWIATSLVGGPVYGVAGRWWRSAIPWRRIAGIGLLGGAFVAEGLARIAINHDRRAGVAMVVAGAAIPLVLGSSGGERVRSLLAIAPVVIVTAIAYELINWAFLHA